MIGLHNEAPKEVLAHSTSVEFACPCSTQIKSYPIPGWYKDLATARGGDCASLPHHATPEGSDEKVERRIEAEKIRVGQCHVSKAKESLLRHLKQRIAGVVVDVRGQLGALTSKGFGGSPASGGAAVRH